MLFGTKLIGISCQGRENLIVLRSIKLGDPICRCCIADSILHTSAFSQLCYPSDRFWLHFYGVSSLDGVLSM